MSEAIVSLSPSMTVLWVLVGIILSLVLPVAVKTLNAARPRLEGVKPTFLERLKAAWVKYGGKRYVFTFLAALLVAVVIVLLFDLQFYAIRDAVLAGFAWESFVNKLFASQNG